MLGPSSQSLISDLGILLTLENSFCLRVEHSGPEKTILRWPTTNIREDGRLIAFPPEFAGLHPRSM